MKIEHNGKTFHFREILPKPRKVSTFKASNVVFVQNHLDEGAKPRFVCTHATYFDKYGEEQSIHHPVKHSAKGEPIRFKSLANAERHINNMNL